MKRCLSRIFLVSPEELLMLEVDRGWLKESIGKVKCWTGQPRAVGKSLGEVKLMALGPSAMCLKDGMLMSK